MKITMGFILLFVAQAQAVEVRNCPKKFTITFSKFSIISSEQLLREIGYKDPGAEKTRQILAKTTVATGEFVINGSRSGRCEYRGEQATGVLATSKSKDWLKLDFDLESKGKFTTYVTISRYSPSSLTANGPASFGWDEHYGYRVFLGNAQVTLK